MSLLAIPYTVLFFAALYVYYTEFSKSKAKLADLPGPKPQSFILGWWRSLFYFGNGSLTLPLCHVALGNLRELWQEQVGYADFKWQEEYGNVVHIKSTLGVSRPTTD